DVWLNSPLPKDRYVAEDYASDGDVDGTGVRDGDAGHANFIAGVMLARSRRVQPRLVRVVDTYGVCRETDLVSALGHAADEPVINLSLGGYTLDDRPPVLLTAALARLLSSGDRVVVAAAGNDGRHDRPFWPAAYAGTSAPWRRRVVAVAAHDGRRICEWSNT